MNSAVQVPCTAVFIHIMNSTVQVPCTTVSLTLKMNILGTVYNCLYGTHDEQYSTGTVYNCLSGTHDEQYSKGIR